jgi:outer membrane receptor protein involved in Fe transport
LGSVLQQSFWLGDRQHINAGCESIQQSVEVDEVYNSFNKRSSAVGAFVADELHLGNAWQVNAGLRDDYSPDYDHALSPRLGLLWQPVTNLECFASYNQAHRAPSLADRYVKVEFNGMLFEGNPDLKPEKLTAYEAGLRWRPLTGLSAAVTGFHNELRDAFDYMLDSDGIFRNHNVTRERSYGLESSLRYQVTPALAAFLNYTRTEGEYEAFPSDPTVEGNRLAYLARDKAGFGVECALPWAVATQLRGRYTGARHGDAQNSAANRLDDYFVLDWHLRWPLYKGIIFTLNVNNLLNEDYEDFPRQKQPDRSFLAGVEWTL